MNFQQFELNYEAVEVIAKEYFIESCGLQSNNSNHKELLAEGLQTLEKLRPTIKLSALVSTIDSKAFHNSTLTIGDKHFTCAAFEQIPTDSVIKVYAYILTIGECNYSGYNLVEEYYKDVWGDAFLEGGRLILRQEIEQQVLLTLPASCVSDSFGPGFYGMSVDKIRDLFMIMNSNLIGISILDNGVCYPEKCCGGFFLVVKECSQLPARECRDCIGNDGGCQFCGGNNRTPSRETCLTLLEKYGTPIHVVRHCIEVAETALRIAKALNEKGWNLDLELLEGAALLHDIARVEKNHGVKGSLIAEKHGFKQVSKLIKCHMFYATDSDKEKINEQDILCLADRMVKENKYVGLDIRMQYVLDKFSGDDIAVGRIRHRLEENQIIKNRIESIIGLTIDQLME